MDVKIAIKIGVVAVLSWIFGQWFTHVGGRPASLLSGLWCVVAAIVVVQDHLGGTYKVAFARFTGIAIGSLMGGLSTQILGATPLALGVAVALTVLLCSLLNLKESYRIASLSVAVVMVSWQFNPLASPWTLSFYRFLDSVAGIFIALAIAHLLWPLKATYIMRLNVAKTLEKLSQLYRLSISLNPLEEDRSEDSLRPLAMEIEQLLIENQKYFEEAKIELMTKMSSVETWGFLLDDLQSIFDAILSLRQVYTKSVYGIFDQSLINQLEDLIRETEKAFHRISLSLVGQQLPEKKVNLNESLEKLENELIRFREGHSTRQFSWPDVQNFFVFFYSLKAVAEELKKMEKRIAFLNSL